MTHPHFVFDVNCLRDDKKIEAAIGRCLDEGLTLLLPDGIGFEIGKVIDGAADKLRKSLDHFSANLHLLEFGQKLTELKAKELSDKQPSACLVNKDLTVEYRKLISTGNGWDAIQQHAEELMPASNAAWADHSRIKELATVAEHILAGNEELQKKIRHNEQEVKEQAYISALTTTPGLAAIVRELHHNDYAADEIEAFLRSPSVLTGFSIGLIALGIRFNYEGIPKDGQVRNSALDIEYAVLGALSGCRLATKDKKVHSVMRIVASVQEHLSRLQ